MSRPLSSYLSPATATLLEAAKTIEGNNARTVLIVDDAQGNKVLGILSEGDILRALLHGVDMHAPVHDIMHVNFKYLRSADLAEAHVLFAEHGFGLLPVVDDDMHVTAVVTMLDCLQKSSS